MEVEESTPMKSARRVLRLVVLTSPNTNIVTVSSVGYDGGGGGAYFGCGRGSVQKLENKPNSARQTTVSDALYVTLFLSQP